MRRTLISALCLILVLGFSTMSFAAYQHEGEQDSSKFLAIYPQKAGTKLDSCATCHPGGSYVNSKGKSTTLGSCQWCHYSYGYDASGNIVDTLNNYGKDYFVNGRSQAAVQAIQGLDSDGDGFTNLAEINANRYPGNAGDDPSKIPAPFKVYTMSELQYLPQHTQFLLMNASRNDDEYVTYSGVPTEDLLTDAGASSTATGITVYAPDGYSYSYPMGPDTDPSLYPVKGPYPAQPQDIIYYYNEQADIALNADGWADYSSPSNVGRTNGDLIVNPDGLKMILAFTREGGYLDPGILNDQNKLDGEGPFRVVPPQRVPSPPDQSSNASNQDVIWPYTENWDHNAGFSARTVTMIKVEPLPAWATDIDILEAGWNYVDEKKIIVYGDLDAAATLDPDLTINIWRAQVGGTRYQGTLTPWSHPIDSTSLYWKLTSVAVSPDTRSGVENVAVDSAGTLTIPDIACYGMHYRVTLTLYHNHTDPSGAYWRLTGISEK
jgi:hypothetical protein